jgi:hypothetical protein
MKCAICGKDCNEVVLHLGPVCGEERRQELLARHRRLLQELAGEKLRALPDPVFLPDFERFALKLAVHLLAGLSQDLVQRYRQEAPWLLNPLEVALEIKERILRLLPAEYVTLEDARGPLRLFFRGTYSFKGPVPARVVLEASVRAIALSALGLSNGGHPPAAPPGTEDVN